MPYSLYGSVYTHTNWEQFFQVWKAMEDRGGENILNMSDNPGSALIREPHNKHPSRLETYMLIIW